MNEKSANHGQASKNFGSIIIQIDIMITEIELDNKITEDEVRRCLSEIVTRLQE